MFCSVSGVPIGDKQQLLGAESKQFVNENALEVASTLRCLQSKRLYDLSKEVQMVQL